MLIDKGILQNKAKKLLKTKDRPQKTNRKQSGEAKG